jgi:hypothetical protein
MLQAFGRHIMDMPDDDAAQGWMSDILEQKILMLRVYAAAVDTYTMRRNTMSTGDFKPSKLKTDYDLRYMPLNLHLQAIISNTLQNTPLQQNGDSPLALPAPAPAPAPAPGPADHVEHIVTVGAFAAHSLKFKQGGIWTYFNKFQKRKLQLAPVSASAAEEDLTGPQYASSMDIWHLRDIPVDPEMQTLAHKASERIDICLAQCLSALVTGFIARIQLLVATNSAEELDHLCALGMLVQFESLLSTQGSESGMLEDMYCTTRFVNR